MTFHEKHAGPVSGDYYLAPGAFWRILALVFLAGAATACGFLSNWVAFLLAALLLSFALEPDVTIIRRDVQRERRAKP